MSQRSLRATVIHSKRISGLCQYRLGTVLDIVEFFFYRNRRKLDPGEIKTLFERVCDLLYCMCPGEVY